MSTFIDFLQQRDRWIKHEPCTKEAIERYETEAGTSLPLEYRAFLLLSDGGTLNGPKERFENSIVSSLC